MLDTSFKFEDGDSIPVFLERQGKQVRFFDDGNVILHFRGRGVSLDNNRQPRFIKSAAESNGVKLNDMGELEIWAKAEEAPIAFSKFIATMTQLASWEKDQIGLSTDTSLLIAEVAQCLQVWKPHATLIKRPIYTGVSGQEYHLDFNFDGEGVIAINPHHVAVNAAIKKLLDIKSRPEHSELRIMAILDDRYDSKTAKREGLVIDALANVWLMSKLEAKVGLSFGKKH